MAKSHSSPSNDRTPVDAATAKAIESRIAEFMSDDDSTRENARLSLVSMGEAAVGALVGALTDRRDQVRWQAAKALGQIGDPKAGPALVEALEDHEFDVRWLAAEGLMAIGVAGLEPLLAALMKRPESLWLRESAHHILGHLVGEDTKIEHHLSDHPVSRDTGLSDTLRPVMAALHSPDSVNSIPVAAGIALDAVRRRGK